MSVWSMFARMPRALSSSASRSVRKPRNEWFSALLKDSAVAHFPPSAGLSKPVPRVKRRSSRKAPSGFWLESSGTRVLSAGPSRGVGLAGSWSSRLKSRSMRRCPLPTARALRQSAWPRAYSVRSSSKPCFSPCAPTVAGEPAHEGGEAPAQEERAGGGAAAARVAAAGEGRAPRPAAGVLVYDLDDPDEG